MAKHILLFTCFLLISSQILWSQTPTTKKPSSDPEAAKILKKLKDKFSTLPAMYAEYLLTIDNRETKETQNGKITQKGNKFHIDNNGNQIFCDAKTLWMYMKSNNVVQINTFEEDEDQLSPSKMLKIYESEKDFFYAITNVDKATNFTEIEFKPVAKDADYNKIRIQVDVIKNEIKYIKVFAKDGTTYTLQIKTVRSASPTDDIFVFNKAKFPGVKVEDLR